MTKKGKLAITILILLWVAANPLLLAAQNSACFGGQVVQPAPPGGTGRPAANALVYICSSASTGVPCTPTATVYTDPTLAHTRAVPFTTDSNGNWTACVGGNSGSYIVQTIPVPGTTYSTFVTASTGSFSSLVINGNTLTAAPGSATITIPNVTDTLVNLGSPQTLVGKTLSAPVINGGTVSGNFSGTPTASGLWTFNGGINSADVIAGGPSIDVRYYKVVADGVTNNVTAMKDAVTAACAAGKALRFPVGTVAVTYTGNDALTVPTGCTLVLIGQSRDASILQFGPSPPTTYYYGFDVQAGANLYAYNIALNGPANNGGGGAGAVDTEMVRMDYGPGTQGFYCRDCTFGGSWFQLINRQNTLPVTDDSTTKATIFLDNVDATAYYQGLGGFGVPQGSLNGCSITASSTALTCTDATFTNGLVGANIWVGGAGIAQTSGGAVGGYAMPLKTTIAAYVSPTQVTLASPAITTVGASTAITDGAMQANRTVSITTTANSKSGSCTACFLPADLGRFVTIPGAGISGGTWTAQIQAYISSSSVKFLLPAPTSVAGASATIVGDGKFTTAQYTFTAGDVGKPLSVPGAGSAGGTLNSVIASFLSSSTVVLQAVAQTTVSGASVTIPGGLATYGVGEYWVTIRNSKFHNLGFQNASTGGYWAYIHPNWNMDITGNTFQDSGRNSIHINTGGTVRSYLLPNTAVISHNGFTGVGGIVDGNVLNPIKIIGNTFRLSGGNAITLQSAADIEANTFNLSAGSAVVSTLGTTLWYPGTTDIKHNIGYLGGTAGFLVGTTPGMTYNLQNNDIVGSTNQPLITNVSNVDTTINILNNQFSGYRASILSANDGWNTFDSNLVTGVDVSGTIAAGNTANLRSLRVSRNTISRLSGAAFLSTSDAVQPGAITGGDNCSDAYNAPNGGGGGWGSIEPCRKVYPGTLASGTTLYLGGSNYGEPWTGYSYNAYHVTGTTAIQTIVIDQTGHDTYFTGSISLIADGAWSLTTGGNIMPCSTGAFAVGSVVTLTHDPRTSMWYQACGVNILPTARGGTGVNSTATFPSSGTVAVTSQLALKGTLTTTAATSDNVTITGVTGTSVCLLAATNASAATNIATTYISAVAADTVTVTHTATASMTYNLLCTPN